MYQVYSSLIYSEYTDLNRLFIANGDLQTKNLPSCCVVFDVAICGIRIFWFCLRYDLLVRFNRRFLCKDCLAIINYIPYCYKLAFKVYYTFVCECLIKFLQTPFRHLYLKGSAFCLTEWENSQHIHLIVVYWRLLRDWVLNMLGLSWIIIELLCVLFTMILGI